MLTLVRSPDRAARASVPAGWDSNPSTWPTRAWLAGAALVGLAVSMYLSLFQLGVLDHVWEPFFGDGSRFVLERSWLARTLPFPDALLGVVNYAADLVIGLPGPADRWRSRPWQVFLFALVVVPMGVAATVLTILQGASAHHWCTLCLTSAAIAAAIVGPALVEVLAAAQHVSRRIADGTSLTEAVRGR